VRGRKFRTSWRIWCEIAEAFLALDCPTFVGPAQGFFFSSRFSLFYKELMPDEYMKQVHKIIGVGVVTILLIMVLVIIAIWHSFAQ